VDDHCFRYMQSQRRLCGRNWVSNRGPRHCRQRTTARMEQRSVSKHRTATKLHTTCEDKSEAGSPSLNHHKHIKERQFDLLPACPFRGRKAESAHTNGRINSSRAHKRNPSPSTLPTNTDYFVYNSTKYCGRTMADCLQLYRVRRGALNQHTFLT